MSSILWLPTHAGSPSLHLRKTLLVILLLVILLVSATGAPHAHLWTWSNYSIRVNVSLGYWVSLQRLHTVEQQLERSGRTRNQAFHGKDHSHSSCTVTSNIITTGSKWRCPKHCPSHVISTISKEIMEHLSYWLSARVLTSWKCGNCCHGRFHHWTTPELRNSLIQVNILLLLPMVKRIVHLALVVCTYTLCCRIHLLLWEIWSPPPYTPKVWHLENFR